MNHEHQPGEEISPGQAPTGEAHKPLNPRIWIGSLADYNNGDLHGDWLEAARRTSEIYADIQRILTSGPAARRGEAPEEWGIFDHDEFGGLPIGEYESIEEVSRLADAVVVCGEPFARWAAAIGTTEASIDRFLEAYRGEFDSAAAYAEELVDGTAGDVLETVSSWLQPYVHIDYDALARDLECNSGIIYLPSAAGGVYVFDD